MKKRSIIYLWMFICAFVLPSFTFPQERVKEHITVQKPSDSLVVNVKFNNPNVIVTDDRVGLQKKLDSQESNNKELISVVREVSENFTKLTMLQERRYESYMDRLQQVSGYTSNEINKFFKQKEYLNITLTCITVVYVLGLIVMYNASYRRLKDTIYAPIILTVLAWISTVLVIRWCWPALMGHDYRIFYELIKLSPV